MESFTLTPDNQGRITLPASWRKAHGIKPGTPLVGITDENALRVQTVDESLDEAQRIVARYARKSRRSAVEDLLIERRRDAKREEREAARVGKRIR